MRVAVVALVSMALLFVAAAADPQTAPSGTSPAGRGDVASCADLAAAAVPQPMGRVSSDDRIARQQRLRARFGLRSTIWWVRKVEATRYPGRNKLTGRARSLFRDFGAKITPSEAQELARRHNKQAQSTHTILTRYGRQHRAEWAGVWIDHTDGTMTAAFTGQLNVHRRALAERIPKRRAWKLIGADHSLITLQRLQERALRELQAGDLPWVGTSINVIGNHVEVQFGVLDDRARAFMTEHFMSDDPVCAGGPDPSELIPEGPQPQSGPGWRLLVDEAGGEALNTSAALNKRQYRRLWWRLDLQGKRAPVDFTREIVLHFAPGVSSTCPEIRLDELVIKKKRVYPLIVMPGPHRACTSDATPYTYLLAVERDALPETFRVQLTETLPCPRCARDRVTHVELR